MVTIDYSPSFPKVYGKIKNGSLKEKVRKHIEKIIKEPEIGKPMKYARKGTREVYIKPFRLSYTYTKEEDKLIFLDLYHKDEQ